MIHPRQITEFAVKYFSEDEKKNEEININIHINNSKNNSININISNPGLY